MLISDLKDFKNCQNVKKKEKKKVHYTPILLEHPYDPAVTTSSQLSDRELSDHVTFDHSALVFFFRAVHIDCQDLQVAPINDFGALRTIVRNDWKPSKAQNKIWISKVWISYEFVSKWALWWKTCFQCSAFF